MHLVGTLHNRNKSSSISTPFRMLQMQFFLSLMLQVSNSSSNYICVVGVGRAVLPLPLVEQFFL
nr:hypothetical protein Q903MT_gene6261 [Picea sitchensis]